MMGFATLDDRTGRLEVAAFSGVYEKYRNLLSKDNILIAEGALNIDDFTNNLRLTAEKLYSMDQARELYARNIALVWDQTEWPKQRLFIEELMTILKPYCGGQCPINIDYRGVKAKTTLQLGDEWRVFPTDELLIKLRRFLSVALVEVKYRT
jgi:DNA polymerase-3 subunit alpha